MASAALAIPESRNQAIRANDRLIVALDFPTVQEAEKLVERLEGRVTFFKIGLHLQLAKGLFEFAERLIKAENKIFLDFKYIDIADTLNGVIEQSARRGIEFVTVFQSAVAIQAAIGARNLYKRPKILTVTLLTDKDQAYLKEEFNTDKPVAEWVVGKAQMVHAAGGDGVIASPQEVCAIRAAIPDPNFLIVTPGIRPSWSQANGHKRAGTPGESIRCGADYLVVGRPIIRASDPVDATDRIVDEMQEAFNNRP
jgi:orotidine-5'-phosphate decarboxylase